MVVFFSKLQSLLTRRDKYFLLCLFFLSIFVSLVETIGVSIIMPFITVASDFTTIQTNVYYKMFYDVFSFTSSTHFVIAFGVFLIIFYCMRSLINLFYMYSLARFAKGRYYLIAYRLFENYLGRSYRDFTLLNSGKLTKTLISEAQNLTTIIQQLLLMSSEVFVVFFVYLILCFVNWKITLLLTLILTGNAFFLTQTVSMWIKREGIKREEAQRNFFELIATTFGNFKMIKLKSNDALILDRFSEQSHVFAKTHIINETLSHTPRFFLEALGFSIVVFIVIFLILKYESDIASSMPMIAVFILGLYRLLPSANRILSGYNQVLFYKKALDIVHNDLIYEIEDLGNDEIVFDHNIILKKLDFGYTKERLILKDVSLTIAKREKVAFIGESGMGKSTLIDMIIGLYKPEQGEIYIDTASLNDQNVKAWRSKIGYIPQDIYLFDGTVAENIAFGKDFDEFKVKQVLRQANIFNFLEENHQGIYTRVGENGILLSGGERQRVAIARALYQDPEILVLDEATSALDSETETKIMKEIYEICLDKTLIIVAHRLSTIEYCDNVYLLEKNSLKKLK